MLKEDKLKNENNSIFVIHILNYDGVDEFVFQLDQIINEYFKKNKQLTYFEKLQLLMRYPYKDYKKTKYSNKADISIFDSLK